MSKQLNILGLMSGTSLDGLDMALCHFDDSRHFRLLAAETVSYPDGWRQRLATLHQATALEYVRIDNELGHWMGQQAAQFLSRRQLKADCIASHGHTVFHQPEQGFTAQIGDPNALCAEASIPVVGDFRRLDVALGGQGAPLVPVGDRLLFGNYDCCINLGGIANLSYEAHRQRIAYDICPCNMALNPLAARQGAAYDRDGLMAQRGTCDASLLQQMESLDYYHTAPPKTLGKEWFEARFLPLLDEHHATDDMLRTVTEHIARRLAASVPDGAASVLLTGGGAHNRFLVSLLRQKRPDIEVVVPSPEVVDYKEAIIFALLAYLRLQGEANALASVTGAKRDSCGGLLCGTLNSKFRMQNIVEQRGAQSCTNNWQP